MFTVWRIRRMSSNNMIRHLSTSFDEKKIDWKKTRAPRKKNKTIAFRNKLPLSLKKYFLESIEKLWNKLIIRLNNSRAREQIYVPNELFERI